LRLRTAIVVILAAILAPAALASEEDAKTFIIELIRGTGATPVVCPIEVLVGSREHEMGVICAEYDGDFRSFESLWQRHVRRDAALDQIDGSGSLPSMAPQTAWESRAGMHERIYVVGSAAVGIRFSAGEIVMVYK
jgi:hypothetical protein